MNYLSNLDQIKNLRDEQSYPAISIFLPTHKAIPARLQDPIRLKDLVKKALSQIDTSRLSSSELDALVVALDRLAQDIDYTNSPEGGIVFLVSKNSAQAYALPFAVHERVVVADNFALSDLEAAYNRSARYWVLALSAKPTRLFKGVGPLLEEVHDAGSMLKEPAVTASPAIENFQKGFPFQLPYQVTSDRQVMAVELGEKDAAYFTELEKQFYHLVDELLGQHLKEHDWPVFLLATEHNKGIFDKITHHKNALVAYHKGDYAHTPVHDIASIVWPLVQNYQNQIAQAALHYFKENAVGSGHAAFGMQNVWRMAQEGRVRMLLVEENYTVLGLVDPQNQEQLVLSSTSSNQTVENLIDRIIATVLAKKGEVFFVPARDLQNYDHIAAVLRY